MCIRDRYGMPGGVAALTTQAALRSSHGSLSPWDLHATLIASGPSFHEGVVSSLPLIGQVRHLREVAERLAGDRRADLERQAKLAGRFGDRERPLERSLHPAKDVVSGGVVAVEGDGYPGEAGIARFFEPSATGKWGPSRCELRVYAEVRGVLDQCRQIPPPHRVAAGQDQGWWNLEPCNLGDNAPCLVC